MTISVGDTLPNATFKTAGGAEDLPSSELFSGKAAVFAVPGAFTGTCTNTHMPGFVAAMDRLREKGVDRVVCISVNDPFVMKAWGEQTGATEAGIVLACDCDASFTKALGLEFDGSARGLGLRSRRYAMVVEDGVVKTLNVEDSPGQAVESSAEKLLEAL